MRLFFILFIFSSFACRKTTILDNTLPRVTASMTLLKKILTSSEEGWTVEATANTGLHYNFWMKFEEDDRVTMISDIGEHTLADRESTYTLRQRQQPTLSFSTYNYISELADPDLGRGSNAGVDFEYAFSVSLSDSLRALEKMGGGAGFTAIKAV